MIIVSGNDVMRILVAISFTIMGFINFVQGNIELGAIEFAIVILNVHNLGGE